MTGDQRFLHTAGTLFRALTINRRSWMQRANAVSVPFRGPRTPDCVIPDDGCHELLLAAFREGARELKQDWQEILSPEALTELAQLAESTGDKVRLPDALWVRLVYEFATVFNKGEGDPDKVIEAFLPVFYGRAASYVREASGMSVRERDALMMQLCGAFDERRSFFQTIWDTYQEWEDDVSRYWTT
jgi:glucosylglycerate synthase